jgi:murein DD-endopeptidase MepM/ murein hydrolase activator NlpD
MQIKFFTSIILLFFVSLSVNAKTVKNHHHYKGYYNSSYGKLSFNEVLVKSEIQGDEFLSNIFEKNNLGFDNLISLSALPDSIFNERRIRAGNTYGVVYEIENQTAKPSKFIYEKNRVDYIVASLNEDFQVELNKKEIEVVEKIASGVINSSLYLTMLSNNTNPLLAVSLSEIYAWTIDFYKIQKGDEFKIIYTEELVEGKSLGIFDIKASTFKHYGKELEAYYHHVVGQPYGDYYDQDGGSMRHTFLKAPVKYSRISSRYSGKRFHPVQKRWKAHLGTDYAAPRGTPIYSTANGIVIASKYSKYNGNYVKVKHNSMYTTQYLHMSKRAVTTGTYVTQGQVIGYIGSTGLATGPHVCYRFWKNGKQVDCNKQDLPRAEPIEEQYLEEYLKAIIPLRNDIKSLKIKQNEV